MTATDEDDSFLEEYGVRSSVDLLRTVVAHGNDAIVVVDPGNDAIRAANPRACELLGYSREELLSLSPSSIHPGEMDRFRSFASAVIEDGTGWIDELTYRTAEGHRLETEVSASAIEIDGRPHLIAFIRDVSDRTDRERELDAQYRRLETLVENAPVVLFVIDGEGTVTLAEGRGLDLLGLESEEIVGESVFDRYDGHEVISDSARRALEGESVHRTITLDDVTYEVWYEPIVDAAGVVDRVIGVAVDVTERERHAARLERLNEATRELAAATAEGEIAEIAVDIARDVLDHPLTAVWRYDPDGETPVLWPLAATASAAALADPDAAADVGTIPDGTAEMRFFRTGESVLVEEYRELEDAAFPERPLRTVLFVPVGEHCLLSVGFRTVTAVDDSTRDLIDILARNARAALERADRERELQRQNERLERFVRVASHDLRNPIAVIAGNLELARETGDEVYLEAIADAVDRMDALIEDLLALARHGELSAVDPADVAGTAWTAVATDETDLEVEDVPSICADESGLHELLANLFRNAVEHGSTGDGDDPAVTVRLGAIEGDGALEGFYVEDDGRGIPAGERETVREMGYSTDEAGTGFGLAIVVEIAAAHGWDLEITEGRDGGARFEFTGVEAA